MKFFIKNRVVSFRQGSKVLDENQNEIYTVKGKMFSITKKKYVKDLEGNLLYKIRNKFWRFWTYTAFIYNADGEKFVSIKSKFRIKNEFQILGTNDEYKIQGQVFSFSYDIIRNGQVIGTIRKKITVIGDAYEVNVDNDQDVPLVIAFVIAVDNILDR